MDSNRLIRSVITVLVVAASVTGFFLLRGLVGPDAAVISVLPVAVVAAYYGTKWGLLATSIAFPANVFLLDRETGDLVSPFVSVSLLLVAWIFGRLHNIEANQTTETADRLEQLRGLEAAAERTRQLLGGVPDTVMRITDAGRIMELHGEEHIGLTGRREEILFRSVSGLSEDWQSDLLKLARSADESGTTQVGRHRVVLNGDSTVIESRVSTIDGGDAVVFARIVDGATLGPV